MEKQACSAAVPPSGKLASETPNSSEVPSLNHQSLLSEVVELGAW
jgi:hypothetical protein